MNKAEFVKLLAKNMDTKITEADKALNILFATIGEAISKEDELKFVGFGTFKASISKAKEVRTPKGEMVKVAEKRQVRFSIGNELKEKALTKVEPKTADEKKADNKKAAVKKSAPKPKKTTKAKK